MPLGIILIWSSSREGSWQQQALVYNIFLNIRWWQWPWGVTFSLQKFDQSLYLELTFGAGQERHRLQKQKIKLCACFYAHMPVQNQTRCAGSSEFCRYGWRLPSLLLVFSLAYWNTVIHWNKRPCNIGNTCLRNIELVGFMKWFPFLTRSGFWKIWAVPVRSWLGTRQWRETGNNL